MRVPAALVAVPLLAGACAGVLWFDAPDYLIVAAAGAAVLALVAGCGFFADHAPAGVIAAVVVGAASAAFSMAVSVTRDLYAPPLLAWFARHADEGDPVMIEGTLADDAVSSAQGTLITVRVRRACRAVAACANVDGGVRLSIGGTAAPEAVATWRAGRSVRASATLRRPTSFSNPGVADDTRALARRGIVLTGSVKSAALVETLAPAGGVDEWASRVREWTRRTLRREAGPWSSRSAAVAIAILIGDRTGLDDEDERRLQDAGTYHVIAISGGNIAILTVLLIGTARLLRLPYRTSAAATILLLLFYGQVAGGAASVGRAITAAVIVLTALVLDRRGAPLNVLSVAAVLAVGVAPADVLDPGFLLSFGATAGIMLGVPALLPPPAERKGGVARLARAWRRGILGVLAASVAADVALLPLAASLFSRVTVAGLALNFVAIPLMTLVQCASLAVLGLSVLWTDVPGHFGRLVHYAADGLIESARLVDFAPGAARDVAAPALWLCAAYYGSAAMALAATRLRRTAIVVLVFAWLAVFVGHPATARGVVDAPPPNVLRVVVLDVGQGDATVVILPDGRAVVVDTGGLAGTSFDVGGRVVLPALRALRVRDVYALVLTHGDPDHIGGAEVLLHRLAPAQLWDGVPVPPHAALRRVSDLAHALRIPWRTVRPGDVDRFGDVTLRVHHPPEPEWERQRVRNDDSIVLEVRYHDVSVLLPGDIGREVESALIPRLALAPLVVLKAAHHGSATSSSEAFIDAVGPQAVIFSAGKNNRFNHPAPVVVSRFAARGIEMFNTASDGAVFVETDGIQVRLWGWKTKEPLALPAGGGR